MYNPLRNQVEGDPVAPSLDVVADEDCMGVVCLSLDEKLDDQSWSDQEDDAHNIAQKGEGQEFRKT